MLLGAALESDSRSTGRAVVIASLQMFLRALSRRGTNLTRSKEFHIFLIVASLDVFMEVNLDCVGKRTQGAGEDLCQVVFCVWGKEN